MDEILRNNNDCRSLFFGQFTGKEIISGIGCGIQPIKILLQGRAFYHISKRTVNEVKKNIDGIVSPKIGKQWMWQLSEAEQSRRISNVKIANLSEKMQNPNK